MIVWWRWVLSDSLSTLSYRVQSHKSGGYFPETLGYTYVIFTGNRCRGLESCRQYGNYISACNAAERMIKKLGGEV